MDLLIESIPTGMVSIINEKWPAPAVWLEVRRLHKATNKQMIAQKAVGSGRGSASLEPHNLGMTRHPRHLQNSPHDTVQSANHLLWLKECVGLRVQETRNPVCWLYFVVGGGACD